MVGEARKERVGKVVREGGPALTETLYVALPLLVGSTDVAAGVSEEDAMPDGVLIYEKDGEEVALLTGLRVAMEDGELESTRETVASKVIPEDCDCVCDVLPLPLETSVVATGVKEKEITGVDEEVTCAEGESVVGAVRVGGIGELLPMKDVEPLRE